MLTIPAAAVFVKQRAAQQDPGNPLPAAGPSALHGYTTIGMASRFVNALVQRVVISHPAPLWIKVEIIWKRPDWDIDVLHLRRRSYKAMWLEEEDIIIREMYSKADAELILQKLPDRT